MLGFKVNGTPIPAEGIEAGSSSIRIEQAVGDVSACTVIPPAVASDTAGAASTFYLQARDNNGLLVDTADVEFVVAPTMGSPGTIEYTISAPETCAVVDCTAGYTVGTASAPSTT